jgi:hypothetical protein
VFDWLLRGSFVVLYLMIGIALLHLWLLAGRLRRFLHQLAAHPMVDAYDRIATKVTGSFGMELRARIPSFEELRVSSYSSVLLATLSKPQFLSKDVDAAYRQIFESAQPALERRARCVDAALTALCGTTRDDTKAQRRGHRALFAAARELGLVLRRLWKLRTQLPKPVEYAGVGLEALLPSGSHSKVPTVALYMGGVDERVFVWMRMAEDFVALRVATFVNHVISHLRNLLTFALLAGLLLVLSMSSYPVQPRRLVMIFSWTLVFVTAAAGFALIVRMRRNEILSRLSGTTPGSVGFDFSLFSQLGVYVVLPVLAVLSNIFPDLRDWIFPWIDPIRQLLP